MSVEEAVNDFIQGVKTGKYRVVASSTSIFEEQPEFTFTVDVNRDLELLASLKEELADVWGKRDRLDEFMNQETFKKLNSEERYAMQRQRESMTDYMAALQKRIELIKERMK